jgi:hypothetical protein
MQIKQAMANQRADCRQYGLTTSGVASLKAGSIPSAPWKSPASQSANNLSDF